MGSVTAVALVLAIALPMWFAYVSYLGFQPDDRVHVVAAGQPGTFQHVRWTTEVQKMDDPSGRPVRPDRQWIRVKITRTALDGEGAIRHGLPASVKLADQSGNSWRTEMAKSEVPSTVAENVIGVPYALEHWGVVPKDKADIVEVHLRPSTYRDLPDQPVEDMMRDSVEQAKAGDDLHDVLRFLRR